MSGPGRAAFELVTARRRGPDPYAERSYRVARKRLRNDPQPCTYCGRPATTASITFRRSRCTRTSAGPGVASSFRPVGAAIAVRAPVSAVDGRRDWARDLAREPNRVEAVVTRRNYDAVNATVAALRGLGRLEPSDAGVIALARTTAARARRRRTRYRGVRERAPGRTPSPSNAYAELSVDRWRQHRRPTRRHCRACPTDVRDAADG